LALGFGAFDGGPAVFAVVLVLVLALWLFWLSLFRLVCCMTVAALMGIILPIGL
jgi:hypothetical protein